MHKNLFLKDKKCCICGKSAEEWEPRFNYFTCKEHTKWSPVKISEFLHSRKKT